MDHFMFPSPVVKAGLSVSYWLLLTGGWRLRVSYTCLSGWFQSSDWLLNRTSDSVLIWSVGRDRGRKELNSELRLHTFYLGMSYLTIVTKIHMLKKERNSLELFIYFFRLAVYTSKQSDSLSMAFPARCFQFVSPATLPMSLCLL